MNGRSQPSGVMSLGFLSGEGIPVWHGALGGAMESLAKEKWVTIKNEITMNEFSSFQPI